MTYVYDGTFEGMLSAIFEAYNDRYAVICREDSYIPPMLEYKELKTDSQKASRVQKGILKKLSPIYLHDIYYLYLSEAEEHATIALRYLRFSFSHGKGARSMLYETAVKDALTLRSKVLKEADRMLGLVRFEISAQGVYVSEIEPDHNILLLISRHFASRLPGQTFVIRDLRRGFAMCSHKGKWLISDIPSDYKFDFSGDEFRSIWKDYFKIMAIKERINPKLQRQYMPARYWAHLPEMS